VTKGGQMQIIDRVKQLVKFSKGEYISLTQATEYDGRADVVDFIFVHANPRHSEPVAIVWPKPNCIEEWTAREITEIKQSAEVAKEIIDSLRKVHK
jgi:long-chain acyl-CoA synthetase